MNINILIFIVIIFLIFLFLKKLPLKKLPLKNPHLRPLHLKNPPLKNSSLKKLDNIAKTKGIKDIKIKIYKGLKIIDKIFNKHGIYYTIAYGTLLGAVRHSDMIDWDDDADIHIKHEDIPKIMTLKEEFKKHNLILEKNWKLLKIYFSDTKYPFIDLFPVYNKWGKAKRCKTIHPECKEINQKWWTSWYDFPYEWLLKRSRYKFGPINIWGITSPLKILKYWYGKKVLEECKSHNYDHITGKFLKPKIVKCVNLPAPQIK